MTDFDALRWALNYVEENGLGAHVDADSIIEEAARQHLEQAMSSPFSSVPSGIEIARWFLKEHHSDWANQGYDGFSLYRNGNDYCYLWVTSYVDFDLTRYWLLEIRTKNFDQDQWETRDYLFVGLGVMNGGITAEWYNHPIGFLAPAEEHRSHFLEGMAWFSNLIVDFNELDDEEPDAEKK